MTAPVVAGDKRMTVREVAEALRVSPSTVKKWVRALFPGLMQNGKTTYLNELHVTCVKQRIFDINGHVGPVTIVTGRPRGLKFVEQYRRRAQECRS